MAQKNKVVLDPLPAFTSHRLPPRDFGVFGPLKTYYSDLASRVTQESITGPQSKQFFLDYHIKASTLVFGSKNI